MTVQQFDKNRARLVQRIQKTFLEQGFEATTMADLADACGMTRRGLYHHFHNKENAFRSCLELGNVIALEDGDEAARKALEEGGSAIDVITAWLDTRFGTTRRTLGLSPHAKELNDAAFRMGMDIMIAVSYESNRAVTVVIDELIARKKLRLRKNFTAQHAARLIADGARGVNQMRPPIPSGQIAQHYREITEAILYGCATES